MQRELVFGLSFVLVIGLAGCAVGPDYERPQVDIPISWRITDSEARRVANIAWWQQFQDPVLDSLIETALQQNKDLAIAVARVDEFAARLNVTRSDLFPQVGYGGSAVRQGISEASSGQPGGTTSSLYSATVNVGWELDVWGRIRRASEAARADILAAEEGRRAVILTLVSSVATGYVGLRSLDWQLEIAQQTLQSREETLRLFEIQFAGGVTSQLQLSQVRSEYEEAAAQIPVIQRQIAQLENDLSVLLGHNPGPIPRGKSIDELALPIAPEEMPSDLLARRPDVSQAEQNLIAANARIGVARAQYFPSISLTGLLGFESSELSNLLDSGSQIWSAGATLTGPIFTAGRVSGQVAQAEAVQRQLIFAYQKSLQTAFLEVNNALIEDRTTRDELDAQGRRLDALKDYVRLAKIRYDNGYSSYIEVLDAQRSLFAVELGYAQTQARVYTSLVNIYKAMGGGWIEAADELTLPPEQAQVSEEPQT